MIASPILHVPVALGTAIFSLGQLHLKTKQPCEYKCARTLGFVGDFGAFHGHFMPFHWILSGS